MTETSYLFHLLHSASGSSCPGSSSLSSSSHPRLEWVPDLALVAVALPLFFFPRSHFIFQAQSRKHRPYSMRDLWPPIVCVISGVEILHVRIVPSVHVEPGTSRHFVGWNCTSGDFLHFQNTDYKFRSVTISEDLLINSNF